MGKKLIRPLIWELAEEILRTIFKGANASKKSVQQHNDIVSRTCKHGNSNVSKMNDAFYQTNTLSKPVAFSATKPAAEKLIKECQMLNSHAPASQDSAPAVNNSPEVTNTVAATPKADTPLRKSAVATKRNAEPSKTVSYPKDRAMVINKIVSMSKTSTPQRRSTPSAKVATPVKATTTQKNKALAISKKPVTANIKNSKPAAKKLTSTSKVALTTKTKTGIKKIAVTAKSSKPVITKITNNKSKANVTTKKINTVTASKKSSKTRRNRTYRTAIV